MYIMDEVKTEELRALNDGVSSSVQEETKSTLPGSSSLKEKQENAESSHAQVSEGHGSVEKSQSSMGQTKYGLQVGSVKPFFSLTGREDRSGPLRPQPLRQQQSARLRSKSVSWKDPMMYLQRLGSFRAPLFSQSKPEYRFRHQPKVSSQHKESSPERRKPSAWTRLLRKLGFDSGKKVHAARAEWLNYDAQSYAMNFEKDRESQNSSSAQQMPKISGPGARDIVTVLLQRSSSHNRNSGSVLIPKPVPHGTSKTEVATPLWQRRSVKAPSSLDLKKFRTFTTGRGKRGTSI